MGPGAGDPLGPAGHVDHRARRLWRPDPLVRRVRPEEFGTVLPACVAMFTEEVGVSPDNGDGGALYRSRVAELIRIGRSYARIDEGRVVFKAEVGAVTPQACQIQGVWVDPLYRGRGHASAGMATVVEQALKFFAPVVTLYVNDYNLAGPRGLPPRGLPRGRHVHLSALLKPFPRRTG